MGTSSKIKREQLFDLFSKNLNWVKELPEISFVPDFNDGYICPLCFNLFDKDDLNPKAKNPLTLEDVPPKSLGGKVMTLTCKDCNSKSGHKLDNHLLNRLLELDSFSFLPNSNSDVSFHLNDNIVNGKLNFDNDGKLEMHIQTDRSNPKMAKDFNRDMFTPKEVSNDFFNTFGEINKKVKTPPFTINFKRKSDEKRAKVALLRIAYLIAFSNLGNAFIINSGLYKIREQIKNPDKDLIPDAFIINYEFPKKLEGINIITEPKSLRSLLIIFRLETKSKSRQFSVLLPGPTEPGIKIYDNFLNKIKGSSKGDFLEGMIEKINYQNFLKDKDLAFAFNFFWQKYTNDDYEHKLPKK